MNLVISENHIEKILVPETALEQQIISEPELQKGLFWGKPRYGHPEGQVIYHIAEVLANIEKLNISPEDRNKLRLITYVHDSFKYLEDKGSPRDWSKHHGVYARKYLEKFSNDPTLLSITELHDEAYYAWQLAILYNHPQKGKQRLNNLINKVGEDLQLYYLFFKCDTRTGDKIQKPVRWFEQTVSKISMVDL